MSSVFLILNNTFIGTILAGGVLALFGLFLYRRQKQIDLKYEDLRELRKLASVLFANIDVVSEKYKAQLSIYGETNPQAKLISNVLNKNFENYFQNEFDKQSSSFSIKITELSDDLIAKLKINSPQYDSEIKVITYEIMIIVLYLSGWSVLRKSTEEEVVGFINEFIDRSDKLKKVLQELIFIKYEI